MKRNLILVFILASFLVSCDSYKEVPYFQDLDRNSVIQENIKNFSRYTIQVNDRLGVYVTSSANPESAMIFNFNLNRVNGIISDNATTNPIVGYMVDEKGEITIPLIGTMKVTGYTVDDLKEQLTRLVSKYVKDPIVSIRILNFRISVMGDVFKPDVYTFEKDVVTLPEALSAAGDLNITAKRTRVLLIREVDGKRTYVPIDLTTKRIFDSPYYYLKNNDIIYVDPDKTKFATVDRGYRNASIILSVASVAAVAVSIYINSRK